VAAAACMEEEPQGLRGEYVTYHLDESLRLCGGTLSHLDEFVGWTAASLGLEIKDTIHYHWLDSEDFLRTPCLDSGAGCFHAGRVYSKKPALPHELVHAVTEQNGMNHARFFVEGIAVALDPLDGGATGPRYRSIPAPGEPLDDPRAAMTADSTDEVDYELAGAFVSYLLLRHGPEKFVAMARQFGPDMDYQAIAAVFADAYGLELDDEVDGFVANGPCDEAWTGVQLHACTGEEVPWGDVSWQWEVSMDCEDPGVVGGSGLQWDYRSYRFATLEIPASGEYEIFTASSSEETKVTLGRCFGCPWQPRDVVLEYSDRRFVELSAGKHFVRITGDPNEGADVFVALLQ
jgi:hypothetical protein